MGFLRRLSGRGEQPRPQARPGMTRQVDVVPAVLDPSWPVLPEAPVWPRMTAEERNALPFEATACPTCGIEVVALPKGKKKCTGCGVYMHVVVVDGSRRRLATEADADILERQEGERIAAQFDQTQKAWLILVSTSGVLSSDSDDQYELAVVGESHYQTDLAALMAALRQRPRDREVGAVALLRSEPTNKWDKNAVRVEIHGRLVGYLASEDAVDVRPWLRLRERKGPVYVLARLGGGWVQDGLVGPIGVTLVNLPDIYS